MAAAAASPLLAAKQPAAGVSANGLENLNHNVAAMTMKIQWQPAMAYRS
jgi:hypothetical protein